jgi:hypothetical protein
MYLLHHAHHLDHIPAPGGKAAVELLGQSRMNHGLAAGRRLLVECRSEVTGSEGPRPWYLKSNQNRISRIPVIV